MVAESSPKDNNFTEGERVLLYYDNLLYDGKILQTPDDTNKDESKRGMYFVRYQGWSDSWDQYVDPSNILKATTDNYKMAANIMQEPFTKYRGDELGIVNSDQVNGESRTLPRKRKNTDGDGGQKDSDGDTQGGGKTNEVDGKTELLDRKALIESMFELPSALKRQLTDEWEFVTKENRLVKLPKPKDLTVSALLNAWITTKLKGRNTNERLLHEVVDGLNNYFDAALGSILLYPGERMQYQELIRTYKTKPRMIYGAEHLLRLFVKLPSLLEKADIEMNQIRMVSERVSEICRFLQKNGTRLFAEKGIQQDIF